MSDTDRLVDDLTAAASRLALSTDPAEDTGRALYQLASVLSALRSPVGRLAGTHRHETQNALDALRHAERALRAVQKAATAESPGTSSTPSVADD